MNSLMTDRGRAAKAQGAKDLWSLGTLPLLALGTISGILGVYWDIAWHSDRGRDTFFSPPHIFIYAAMLLVMVLGIYSMLRDKRESPLHIRLGNLRVQPGIVIVTLGAAITFFFAPADELWHRLFGADLTLWAPMHLIGLLGLTMACLGGFITTWIERHLTTDLLRERLFNRLAVVFAAGFLAWSILMLAEYDFGYPVFSVWLHVALLSALPSLMLVAIAKLRPVPFAATVTALLFTAFRLVLELWLITSNNVFNWGGESRPMIALLIFTGLAADLLVQRKAPILLIGFVLGIISLLSNWFVTSLSSNVEWFSQALLVGIPVGLVLSALMAWLGMAMAKSLEAPTMASQ